LEEHTSFGSYRFIEWGSQVDESVVSVKINESGDLIKTDSDGVSEVVGFYQWGLRKIASILCLFLVFYMLPMISKKFPNSVEYKNKIRPLSFIVIFIIFTLVGCSIAGTLVWFLAYLSWDLLALRFYNRNKNKHEDINKFQEAYEDWFSPILNWSGNFFLISIILFLTITMGAS